MSKKKPTVSEIKTKAVQAEKVTFNILRLSEILSADDCEILTESPAFTWGDTNVVLVKLSEFLSVCDRLGIKPAPGTCELIDADVYVALAN